MPERYRGDQKSPRSNPESGFVPISIMREMRPVVGDLRLAMLTGNLSSHQQYRRERRKEGGYNEFWGQRGHENERDIVEGKDGKIQSIQTIINRTGNRVSVLIARLPKEKGVWRVSTSSTIQGYLENSGLFNNGLEIKKIQALDLRFVPESPMHEVLNFDSTGAFMNRKITVEQVKLETEDGVIEAVSEPLVQGVISGEVVTYTGGKRGYLQSIYIEKLIDDGDKDELLGELVEQNIFPYPD